MGLERAVDIQRDALLRLLARLLIAVEMLSYAPFEGKVTRWVCCAVSSVLDRAELAADYLVIASARGLVARGLAVPERALTLDAPRARPFENDMSCGGLRRRIAALRALLNTLPRHALRLLRQRARCEDMSATDFPAIVSSAAKNNMRAFLRFVSRVVRPPDKHGLFC